MSESEPDFLSVAHDFQLGALETEQCHPETTSLSTWAREDLPRAIRTLWEVDLHVLAILEARLPAVALLAQAIDETLAQGDRVFLCGCGATGRLSISIEVFARQGLLPDDEAERIISFMAGGDAALIRSIEHFEDLPAFGERQLKELGFRDGDLLVSSTEGGETPFVIGATESAAAISRRRPYFLYGNPDEILRRTVERSRRVLENDRIRKLELAVGPMALSGSTRMQSSTVLMAAVGFALKHHADPDGMPDDYRRWLKWVRGVDPTFLEAFILSESQTYAEGAFVLYQPGPYRLTVLTDTTERSPTFTFAPFEREGCQEPPSLCYLRIPEATDATEAWRHILQRDPRPLEWGPRTDLTGAAALRAFDFSTKALAKRRARTGGRPHYLFTLERTENAIVWHFRENRHVLEVPPGIGPLGENLLLKMLLNSHSTLVAGRMGRYADNLMTHVSASNFKLIDRSTRYARTLLKRHHGLEFDYETVARQVVAERRRLQPGEAIVLKTVEALAAK